MILEIRRERAIELVMEGFRYYDLMRWKEGQCMAQSFKGFYLPATAINKAYDMMETEQMMSFLHHIFATQCGECDVCKTGF